ncbi:hypothetical protein PanWU01x14_006350 [Parasponia andersonii]|uniref:Uncharacterized protein n=1 Tax=Parasponia andersonii TaxID=3476 RepID=A0A2P5E3R8_PARAD|nr:hypothetical protein PanWU01x14_006350 [Parasponia andersonii]
MAGIVQLPRFNIPSNHNIIGHSIQTRTRIKQGLSIGNEPRFGIHTNQTVGNISIQTEPRFQNMRMDLLALEDGGDGGARPQSRDQSELVIRMMVFVVHGGTKEETEIVLRRSSGGSGSDASEKRKVGVRKEWKRLGSQSRGHQTRPSHLTLEWTQVLEGNHQNDQQQKFLFFIFFSLRRK